MNKISLKNIKNKKISIIGYGISGISATRLALYLGAKVFISEKGLINENDKLNKNISFEEGRHSPKCYNCDFAIISPGINTNDIFFKEFKKRNIPIISEIEFASWFTKSTIIAITGSNGKSTTVSLLHSILKEYKKTYLGGNIGIPFSSNVLKEIKNKIKDSIHILELSSFQLEHIHHFKPKIACILNLSNDHLDRYSKVEDYYNAKKNIFKNIDQNSYFIYNANNKSLYANNIINRIKSISFSINNNNNNGHYYLNNHFIIEKNKNKKIIDCSKIQLLGKHNIENILAILEIIKLLNLGDKDLIKSIYNFPPLEHRMERISTNNDITFINDSKATNPDSTIRAISCSKEDTILILGGYSKGKINYKEIFINKILSNVQFIICYGNEGKIIHKQLKNISNCLYINNFEKAIISAIKLAKSNYRVLLSPACSSFDQFKSFEERGEKFKTIVKQYYA